MNHINRHIAVLASGTGTTLQALLDNQSQYGYCVSLVIANRECMAIERAQAADIAHLQTKDWDAIDQVLTAHSVRLVVLAGFLAILPEWFCRKWQGRIINIHPSLLPKHGGKGMYGIYVQESVLAAGDTEAGCTVHYVSAEIDGGAIIAQSRVPVLPDDTPHTLAARVQQQEKILLPRIVGEICKQL